MTPNGTIPPIPTRADLEAAGIKIAVGIPFGHSVSSSVVMHLWEIARRGWPLLEGGFGRTDVNRNRLADALMKSDYTHVMMLDMDQLHLPDVVERHARWLLADPSRLVIGGLHFRRGVPFDPLVFILGMDGEFHSPLEWPAGLVECHALGHGTLLVHRSVFERLGKPYWGYDYGQAEHDRYPSEDMYFCHQCRAAGIRLWADMTITSPHIFETVIDEAVFRQFIRDHADQMQLVER